MTVDAHTVAARHMKVGDPSGRRPESIGGIFGVDTALHGIQVRIIILTRYRYTRGNLDLFFDQVIVGYFFGDGMFHLDAGVHLHEVEVSVLVEEEFDGTRTDRKSTRLNSSHVKKSYAVF